MTDPTTMPITATLESSSDSLTAGVTVGNNDVVVGTTEMVGVGVVNTLDGITIGNTRK